MSLPVAVLASGSGTNLQALLDHEVRRPEGAYKVSVVVSDREGAEALERASKAGRTARVVPSAGRDPGEVADELGALLREAGVEAVFLAGYLTLVPEGIIQAYRGRILNVHPSLLPAFGGKGMYGERVHQAVLERGCRITGVTVHFVDEEYDRGPVLAQWPVPVMPDDTPESLGERVLDVEHLLFPLSAEYLCRALSQGFPPRPLTPFGDTFLLGLDAPGFELRRQIRRAYGET